MITPCLFHSVQFAPICCTSIHLGQGPPHLAMPQKLGAVAASFMCCHLFGYCYYPQWHLGGACAVGCCDPGVPGPPSCVNQETVRVEGQVQHHREGDPSHLMGGQLSSLSPPWLLPLFGSHSTAVDVVGGSAAGEGWSSGFRILFQGMLIIAAGKHHLIMPSLLQ